MLTRLLSDTMICLTAYKHNIRMLENQTPHNSTCTKIDHKSWHLCDRKMQLDNQSFTYIHIYLPFLSIKARRYTYLYVENHTFFSSWYLDHFIAIYIIDNSLLLCFSSLVFSVLYSLLRKRRTNLKCQTVDGWHTSNKRKWSFVYNKCVNNMYRTFTMMK